MRLGQVFYAVMPSPIDGSVWGTIRYSPAIVRIAPGSNSCWKPRFRKSIRSRCRALASAAATSTSKGVVWASLASGQHRQLRPQQVQRSAQRTERDRRPLPRGLVVLQVSGPGLRGHRRQQRGVRATTAGSTSTTPFGMGKDVPVSTANLMDGLVALGKDGKMVSLRVPYPMGFYAKGLDGRIDDPNAGLEGPRPVDLERRPCAVAGRAPARAPCPWRYTSNPPRSRSAH